jgi:hypothetical protein
VRPSLILLIFWVISGWVNELAVVVLGQEVGSNGVGNSQEVLHMDGVADVGVEVVLEMLEHVHVLAHEVISSDSWEGESLVKELPGLHAELWNLVGSLLLEGVVDVNNVSPVSWVKGSGEHFHLVLELSDSLVEVDAWGLNLNEGLVSNWSDFELGSGDSTEQHKDGSVFHLQIG